MKNNTVRLASLVFAWGATALVAGASHALASVPPIGVPFLIGIPTVAFGMAAMGTGWVNSGMQSLGLRGMLIFHAFRFVGLYFIWLSARGRLPQLFAERAGWGDVATAAGALLLLFSPRLRASRLLLLAWNLFGLADLTVAVGTAAWLGRTMPLSMAEITTLPLALIPLWLVPMYMASHLFLLRGLTLGVGQGKGTCPQPS